VANPFQDESILRGQMRHFVVLAAIAALVAACATGPKGVRVVNNGTSAIPAQEGQTIRNLSAKDINGIVVGKTFQYTRKDGNGFVTYNADGTLTIQDDTRGSLSGKWSASGEQYCEVYAPGAAAECGVFKSTGDAYFAANSRLVEMNI
jgi:hypothetical protein